MPVDRLLPNDEARDLIALVRDIADKRMAPIVDQHEKDRRYPDGLFAELGEAGLLGLPYPTEWDGGGQPYEVYLQVLEELGARWAAVAVAVSVHGLACHPLFNFGTDVQKQQWLPDLVAGRALAGFALTEAGAGSDAGATARDVAARLAAHQDASARPRIADPGDKILGSHPSRAQRQQGQGQTASQHQGQGGGEFRLVRA